MCFMAMIYAFLNFCRFLIHYLQFFSTICTEKLQKLATAIKQVANNRPTTGCDRLMNQRQYRPNVYYALRTDR